MIYTTVKDFELFKKECKKWIDRLGLHEWEIVFIHVNLDNASANITSLGIPKMAIIRFTKAFDYTYPTKSKMVKSLAQHEVFHLLLADLYEMASDRIWNSERYETDEHAIIHRLQKAFRK